MVLAPHFVNYSGQPELLHNSATYRKLPEQQETQIRYVFQLELETTATEVDLLLATGTVSKTRFLDVETTVHARPVPAHGACACARLTSSLDFI